MPEATEIKGKNAKRFKVALSFPGEHRAYVKQIADILASHLGGEKMVLYDDFHTSEFARLELDVYLPELYRNHSEMIVIFLCRDYENKRWCNLEWRTVRSLICTERSDEIMPIRLDDAEISGIFPGDGYVFAPKYSTEHVAGLILERHAQLSGTTNPSPSSDLAPTSTNGRPEFDHLPSPVSTLGAPNLNFVGRKAELEKLDNILRSGQIGVLVAVHGLGGLGKTALARAYAHNNVGVFPGGQWEINCVGQDDLGQRLVSLAEEALDLRFASEERRDPELVRHRALRLIELKAAGEPVLLILDNVDRPDLLVSGSFEKLQGFVGLTLLVTSRLGEHELQARNGGLQFLNVDALSEEDALALLNRYRPLIGDEERRFAAELTRRLGFHTLAIELAAAFLGEHKDVGIAGFVRRLEDEGLDGLEAAVSNTHKQIFHAERSVRAALTPTWEALSVNQRVVLAYAAELPSERIPLIWLKAVVGEEVPEFLEKPAPGYPDSWAQILLTLESQRLLIPFEVSPIARMHGLLQEVVAKLTFEQHAIRVERLIEIACGRVLHLKHDWVDLEKRWEIGPLADFAEICCKNGTLKAINYTNLVSELLTELGRYSEAEALLCMAMEIEQQNIETGQSHLATSIHNLGVLYLAMNRLAEAETLCRSALAIREASYGSEHWLVATTLNCLALILKATTRQDEAEVYFRRALNICELTFGPEDLRVAIGLNNLALLLQETGRLVEAEQYYRRAMEIQETSLGPESLDLAATMGNLATLLNRTHLFDVAEHLFRRSLQIKEKNLGEDHSDVATSMSNLASLLKDTNRRDEAEVLLRRALEIKEKCLGSNHSDVATALVNLAFLLQNSSRLSEAEPLSRRALGILIRCSVACGHALAHLTDTTERLSSILKARGVKSMVVRTQIEAIFAKEGLPRKLWPHVYG